MLKDYPEIFARCCANPLPHPEEYEQTPVGAQQYKTHYDQIRLIKRRRCWDDKTQNPTFRF